MIVAGLFITFKAKAIGDFIVGLGSTVKQILGLNTALKGTASGMQATATATNTASVAMTGFQRALGIIGLVITAGALLVTVFSEIGESAKKTSQTISDSVLQYKEQAEELKNIQTYYEKNYHLVSSDTAVKDQLYQMQNKLIETFGKEAEGIDFVNKKYDENIKKIQEVRKAKLEDELNTLQINVDAYKEKKYGDPKITEKFGFIWQNEKYDVFSTPDGNIDILTYYYKLLEVKTKIQEHDKSMFGRGGDLLSIAPNNAQEWANALAAVQDELNKIEPKVKEINSLESRKKEVIKLDVDISSSFDKQKQELFDKLSEGMKNLPLDEYVTKINLVAKALLSWNGKNIDDLQEKLDKIDKLLPNISDKAKNTGETVEEAFSLENALKDLDKLKNIIKELNDNDTISYDSLQYIIDNYKQLLPYINDHKKLKQELTKISKEEDEKIKQSYKELAYDKIRVDEIWYKENIKGNKELIDKIHALYKINLGDYNNLGQAKLAIDKEIIARLAGSWSIYFDELGNLNNSFYEQLEKDDESGKVPTSRIRVRWEKGTDLEKKIKEEIEKTNKEFDKITLGDIDLSKVGLDKDKDKKSTSNQYDTKYVKEYNAEVDKLTSKLTQLNNEYKALLESGADYATLHKKLTEIIDTEIKKQEALHIATEKMRKKQAELQSQAKGYGVNVNGTQDEIASQVNSIKDSDKRKIVLDIIKDYNDLSKAIISNQNEWWQSQFKKNETLKQDAQNYLNSLTKENDLKKSSIDLELKLSEARKKNYEVGSEKYIEELNVQIQLNKEKQKLLHAEAEALRKILAAQKEGSAEYLQTQQKILGLQGDWVELQNSNEDLELDKKFSVANKVIADTSKAIQKLDDDMKLLDDNDIAGQMNIIGQKIIVKSDEIKNLKNEIDKLLQLPVSQRTANYNKQLEDLNEQLRKAIISLKEFNDQVYDLRERQLNDFESTVKEIEDKIVTAKRKKYEEDKKNYLDALREKYEQAKEFNKQIADDEEKRHKEQLERYDEDYKKFDELVNAKINKIDEEQKAKEDNDTVDKLNKEILDIQKQINEIALDDTIATKTKREGLEKQLVDKQKELTKFQDKTLADSRKKNLKDELDKNKKSVEDLKKAENEKYEANKNRINKELENIEDAYKEEVKLTEKKYDDLLSSENLYLEAKKMLEEEAWEDIITLINEHSIKFESGAGVLGDSIQKNLIDKLTSVKNLWSEILGYSPSNTDIGQGLVNAKEKNEQSRKANEGNHRPPEKQFQNMSDEDWFAFVVKKGELEKAKTMKEINDINATINTISARNGINYDLTNKYTYKDLISFKTGGYTGDNEGLAWLDKKEIILKDMDTSNILKTVKIVRDMSSFLNNFKVPNITKNNNSNSVQNISMPITIHVPEGTKLNENKLGDIFEQRVKKNLYNMGFKPAL